MVRYTTKEIEWTIRDKEISDVETFLALPHEARLAKVRVLKANGDQIAKIVSHAVDNHLKDDRVSEIELYEILADYLLKPSFRQYYLGDKWRRSHDGWGEFTAGKEIEALWLLVPAVPASLAHLLIETLPPEVGLSGGIPSEVIGALTDYQLATLLYRPDIGLHDLRQEIFRTAGKDRERLLAPAISSNFSIENAEFKEILGWPEKRRIATLRSLATYAGDLRLCVYEALHDYLSIADKWEDAAYAEIAKERRLDGLQPGWRRDKELRQLRLYLLARQTAPLTRENEGGTVYPPHGDVEFLARHIKKGDPWQTFIAFEGEWQSSAKSKALDRCLPRIDGVDPDDDCSDIHLSSRDRESIVVFKQELDQILATLRSTVDLIEGGSSAIDALRQVAKNITILQEFVADDSRRLHGRIVDLEQAIERAMNRKINSGAIRDDRVSHAEGRWISPLQPVIRNEAQPSNEMTKIFEHKLNNSQRTLYIIIMFLSIIILRVFL